VGFTSEKKLFEQLRAIFPELPVYPVGDCTEPRDAMEALREGEEVGRAI